MLTAPGYVDLCPGPFEDTQFDAVIDVETSDDCLDDEGTVFYYIFLLLVYKQRKLKTCLDFKNGLQNIFTVFMNQVKKNRRT